jgi:hypothetical protein
MISLILSDCPTKLEGVGAPYIAPHSERVVGLSECWTSPVKDILVCHQMCLWLWSPGDLSSVFQTSPG